ncbi:MAG: hypothetical protein GY861_28095 [bacterium]|nr:hypothetical protein [bacterium]
MPGSFGFTAYAEDVDLQSLNPCCKGETLHHAPCCMNHPDNKNEIRALKELTRFAKHHENCDQIANGINGDCWCGYNLLMEAVEDGNV